MIEDPFLQNLKKTHLGTEPKKESTFDILGFNKNNIASIKESIEQIKYQINDRDKLKEMTLKRLDSLVSDINNLITKKNAELDIMQGLMLIKEQRDIDKLKLEEELNAWRDKAKLNEELREHLKELRELELKTQELNDLIQ